MKAMKMKAMKAMKVKAIKAMKAKKARQSGRYQKGSRLYMTSVQFLHIKKDVEKHAFGEGGAFQASGQASSQPISSSMQSRAGGNLGVLLLFNVSCGPLGDLLGSSWVLSGVPS